MGESIYIEIDKNSGFCFGVVNAISLAERSLHDCDHVYCLGDIVHNRLEVQRLEAIGLKTIEHAGLSELSGKKVLIRAHGEPPSTYQTAKKYGIEVIDATCPVVAQLQRIVADAYEAMNHVDGQVVILGKRGHAEVVGLTGQTDGSAIIIEGLDDIDTIDFTRPVYFLAQTTQSLELFGHVADRIRELSTCPENVTIRDTICRQVSSREAHLREFAGRFDTVIFVSGRKSSNGKVLFDVCREANPTCHNIEGSTELRHEWFAECRSVGICGATSTPHWLMEEVAERIMEITSNTFSGLQSTNH